MHPHKLQMIMSSHRAGQHHGCWMMTDMLGACCMLQINVHVELGPGLARWNIVHCHKVSCQIPLCQPVFSLCMMSCRSLTACV